MQGVRFLPTLPSLLFRFLGLIADPEVPEKQLAEFIYRDPALLSRVLPLLQASRSGESVPASYWKQAIASLGRKRIRQIAFTTPLLRSFDPLQVGYSAVTFWERSLLCAQASEALAVQMQLPEPERYYIAGLFHDIGHLLFLHKKPAAMYTVIQRVAAEPTDWMEIESEVMGIDHCQLGLFLAARLKLEPWVRRAIEGHHCPTPDAEEIIRITCIGSAFCHYKRLDFFSSRNLVPYQREREIEGVIGNLLPELPQETTRELLRAMEQATEAVQNWVSEAVVDFYLSGESYQRTTTDAVQHRGTRSLVAPA